jgi:hypothetical protein
MGKQIRSHYNRYLQPWLVYLHRLWETGLGSVARADVFGIVTSLAAGLLLAALSLFAINVILGQFMVVGPNGATTGVEKSVGRKVYSIERLDIDPRSDRLPAEPGGKLDDSYQAQRH